MSRASCRRSSPRAAGVRGRGTATTISTTSWARAAARRRLELRPCPLLLRRRRRRRHAHGGRRRPARGPPYAANRAPPRRASVRPQGALCHRPGARQLRLRRGHQAGDGRCHRPAASGRNTFVLQRCAAHLPVGRPVGGRTLLVSNNTLPHGPHRRALVDAIWEAAGAESSACARTAPMAPEERERARSSASAATAIRATPACTPAEPDPGWFPTCSLRRSMYAAVDCGGPATVGASRCGQAAWGGPCK